MLPAVCETSLIMIESYIISYTPYHMISYLLLSSQWHGFSDIDLPDRFTRPATAPLVGAGPSGVARALRRSRFKIEASHHAVAVMLSILVATLLASAAAGGGASRGQRETGLGGGAECGVRRDDIQRAERLSC